MHPCLGGTPKPTDPASGKQQPTDFPCKVNQQGCWARQCSLGGSCHLPMMVRVKVRVRCSPCSLMTKTWRFYTQSEEKCVKGDWHGVLLAVGFPVLVEVPSRGAKGCNYLRRMCVCIARVCVFYKSKPGLGTVHLTRASLGLLVSYQ